MVGSDEAQVNHFANKVKGTEELHRHLTRLDDPAVELV